jgi:fructan beta-fructosidase
MTVRSQIPVLHFTTPVGWLNDPNGLVFADGFWHLYYQHHPHSLEWGPMHWGHARSSDLTVWEHLPIALVPSQNGAAFSGSAVIDHYDTAGFGSGALVALYTLAGDGTQFQGIASSTDGGITLTPSLRNPVLKSPEGIVDFRDPKVFPFEGQWRMVLSVGTEVWIYGSANLHDWTLLSTYRDDPASGWSTWETPDLVPLVHPLTGDVVWVLTIGMTSNAPTGASGTYYRTGTFDGVTFVATDDAGHWADHGPDFYAAQSWSNTGDNHVWIAWMNNWRYSQQSPHGVGRGFMSLARQVGLQAVDNELLLTQRPIVSLDNLDADHEIVEFGVGDHGIESLAGCVLSWVMGSTDFVEVVVKLEHDLVGVHIDGASRAVRLVRSGPAAAAIEHFALDTTATVPGTSDFDVSIVVDIGTFELFAANGTLTMSALTNKVQPPNAIEFSSSVPVSALMLLIPDSSE